MSTVMRKHLSFWIVLAMFAALVQVVSSGQAEAAEVKLNIVAMGDSYTSGNGALNYFGASNCYKSHNNYAEQLSKKFGGIDVDYRNLACNGAKNADLRSQVYQLTARERWAVDLVRLTTGGNDVGFSDVVKQCFAPVLRDADGCRAALDKAKSSLAKAAADAQQKLEELAILMPEAKIVLVGYPNLLDQTSDSCHYAMYGSSGIVEPVSETTQMAYQFEADQYNLIDKLNAQFKGRFSFVSLKALFKGHENCGSLQPWLRSFFDTAIVQEWWHPNKEGHTAIANHLYGLGVHKGAEDTFRYGDLPLSCGVTVPRASTYDSMSAGSRT